eukprot:364508-Chlamydomonas_euryale.AAC.5
MDRACFSSLTHARVNSSSGCPLSASRISEEACSLYSKTSPYSVCIVRIHEWTCRAGRDFFSSAGAVEHLISRQDVAAHAKQQAYAIY